MRIQDLNGELKTMRQERYDLNRRADQFQNAKDEWEVEKEKLKRELDAAKKDLSNVK